MSPAVRTAKAFVPGHITGFFRIYDEPTDVLRRGSLGAGFSISAGTLTKVRITEQEESRITVTYNDDCIDAKVSCMVAEQLLTKFDRPLRIDISHLSELPIGVGFGASGAGALGTALALSHLLSPEFEYNSAAQVAHAAEVENHTGLGDVLAQTVGGLEIRTRPGGPGIGEVRTLSVPEDLVVVLAGKPGLDTKDVLTSSSSRNRINEAGDFAVSNLPSSPNIDDIVRESRNFAYETGLITPRVDAALNDLDASGYSLSSMVMIGDSVFCFCEPQQVSDVEQIVRTYWEPNETLTTTIATAGGAILK